MTMATIMSVLALGVGAGLGAAGPGDGARATTAGAPPATTADLQVDGGRPIALPPPAQQGGLPLMSALAARHSTREFRPDPLPLGVLSDLLWSANGINRKAEGKHTAATARNWQNLEVYVATARGLFRYDPDAHALLPVRPDDLRAATGAQPFVGEVPVNLVYVSDRAKFGEVRDESDKTLYDGVHAGLVAQNVYLFAASAGLATVLRAHVDRAALGAAMGLRSTQQVIVAQSVGYAK